MVTSVDPPTAAVAIQLPPLLDIPLELMLQVIEMLTVPELRMLGRANRGLHSFIADYLSGTYYTSAIFSLPKEVLAKIATYVFLDLRGRTSRSVPNGFARTSQKFYPALMEHAVHLAIENGTNHFLYYAIKYNKLKVALKMLRLGADVHGKDSRCGRYSYGAQDTPLTHATGYGQEAMVRILLDAGAGRCRGVRDPLKVAICHGHERIALLLWADLILHNPGCPFWYGPYWLAHCSTDGEKELLFLACDAGFIDLSRAILQRHNTFQWHRERVEIRTCLLFDVLHQPAYRYCNRHAITKLLLEYGADPDLVVGKAKNYNMSWRYPYLEMPSGTIREWASEKSDPRMREMLSKIQTTHVKEPCGTSSPVGEMTVDRRENQAWEIINAYWEEETDLDLRMLNMKKSRVVKVVRTKREDKSKIKSLRQITRTSPAHR